MNFFALLGFYACIYYIVYIFFLWYKDCNFELAFAEKFGNKLVKLHRKVVWVTEASSDLGKSMALKIAKNNGKLAISSNLPEKLKKVKTACLRSNPSLKEKDVLILLFDTKAKEAYTICFWKILKHFGTLDILIVNEDEKEKYPWEYISTKSEKALFEDNVFKVLSLTRLAIKYFKIKKKGKIAVTSSIAGLIGAPYFGSYTGTKHALHGYFNALKIENLGENIQTTLLCLGPIEAKLKAFVKSYSEVKKWLSEAKKNIPRRKLSSNRCAHLCLIAIVNDLDEVWMAGFPILPCSSMEPHKRTNKKLWKPPSFEEFNLGTPTKKAKLQTDEFLEDNSLEIPNEVVEPKNISDLAIHPKKVEEVRSWIRLSFQKKAPVLLVTGPSGSGKTTTIKVAANSEGVKIVEWVNPIDKTEYKSNEVLSCDIYDKFSFSETKQTDKFFDFMFRCSRYNSLFEKESNNIILVEDMPNIFIWKPKLLTEFLEKNKLYGRSPLIFIISEDQNLKLCNELFPSHVKTNYDLTHIKFNPVNNTSMIKNLKALTELYCSEKISTLFFENVSKSSNGDIRSATNDLLLYLRTNIQNLNQLSKGDKTNIQKKDSLWATSKYLSLKDTKLDFYHNLGRVLYPKLFTENEKKNNENSKRLFVHDVWQIAEHWCNLSLSVLYENYLETFSEFNDIVKGAECFSFCDILGSHLELNDYTSLYGVTELMCLNSKPKKKGFIPIKKSCHLNMKFHSNTEKELERLNFGISGKNFYMDIIPFVKVLNANCNLKSKVLLMSDMEFNTEESNESCEDVQIDMFDN